MYRHFETAVLWYELLVATLERGIDVCGKGGKAVYSGRRPTAHSNSLLAVHVSDQKFSSPRSGTRQENNGPVTLEELFSSHAGPGVDQMEAQEPEIANP